MCGRFTMATPGQTIAELFRLDETPELSPRFNIAPTQAVAAVRARRDGGRELVALTWGLVPSWAKDRAMGARMINARAETVAEKPAFRAALRVRRCLVLADGFYEWQKLGTRKQPHHIRLRDGRPFAFAGLWERWAPPGAEPVESCTIITTTPSALVAPIHDRMPVILAADAIGTWLDPSAREPAAIVSLLRPYPADEMVAYPVSLRVNNPGADDPSCVAPLT